MFELLLAPALWFWIVFVGFIVLMTWTSERNHTIAGAFGFIGFLAAGEFLLGVPVFGFIKENPVSLIGLVILYLIIGAFWAARVNWREFCRENKIPDEYHQYLKDRRLTEQSLTEDEFLSDPIKFSLHPKRHYDKLIHWILFWPFNAFWFFLHRPITWLGRTVYDIMGGIFHRIAVAAYKS